MAVGEPNNEVLLFILEWVWVPILTVVMWLVKKVFGHEKELAVLHESVENLGNQVERYDERNEYAHGRIEGKIDDHHSRVMSRIDEMIKLIRKNGS